MRRILIATLLPVLFSPLWAESLKKHAEALTRTQMQSVIQILSDDLFEGRAPGTRGGELAERYCRSMFKWMNLEPGWKGSFFQPFVMKAFTTLEMTAESDGISLNHLEDIVGSSLEEQDVFSLEGDLVFVGFGIKSDIWKWDDFKNTSLKDKIIVVRVNDPGSIDPKRFEGRIMTYFGRWRYKIEEAQAQGAKGILIIHTDSSAGYGWPVVQNSWSGEQLHLPESLNNNLKFSGWIKESSLRKVLARKKIDLDRLYASSMKKSFKPVPLNLSMKITGKSRHRQLTANNVLGEIPGKSGKRIVLLAHIDHLGLNPNIEGDQIFNGAIDNGSAVAAMMLTTRILSENRKQLNHSVTVLACQAEEEGLLGSLHYALNTDRSNILAAINFESSPVWENSKSLMGVGARFSTLEELLQDIAKEEGVTYTEFSLNDQGFFFRADQYPFAQLNIPALWISAGEEFGSGKNRIRDFFSGDYHTPKDEYHEDWDLGSLRQTIKYALMLVERLQTETRAPQWKRKLTFPTIKQ